MNEPSFTPVDGKELFTIWSQAGNVTILNITDCSTRSYNVTPKSYSGSVPILQGILWFGGAWEEDVEVYILNTTLHTVTNPSAPGDNGDVYCSLPHPQLLYATCTDFRTLHLYEVMAQSWLDIGLPWADYWGEDFVYTSGHFYGDSYIVAVGYSIAFYNKTSSSWNMISINGGHDHGHYPYVFPIASSVLVAGNPNYVDILDTTTGMWTMKNFTYTITFGAEAQLDDLVVFINTYGTSSAVDVYNGTSGVWSTLSLTTPRVLSSIASTPDHTSLFIVGSGIVDVFSNTTTWTGFCGKLHGIYH
jgi:hypothetical protein